MKKYKVTEEFMNELIKWFYDNYLDLNTKFSYSFIDGNDINRLPDVVVIWWAYPDEPTERNNRLIAIIQWLNCEDVFEVVEIEEGNVD